MQDHQNQEPDGGRMTPMTFTIALKPLAAVAVAALLASPASPASASLLAGPAGEAVSMPDYPLTREPAPDRGADAVPLPAPAVAGGLTLLGVAGYRRLGSRRRRR